MNKILTGKKDVKELTVPKISVSLFVHDIIIKEKVSLQNFVGVKEEQKLMQIMSME